LSALARNGCTGFTMDVDSEKCTLLIFAKAPVPGAVKTRMQPFLDVRQSALLHQNLVEHCLATATGVSGMNLELCVGGHHDWWEDIREKYSLAITHQVGADLGQRMCNAAGDCLDAGGALAIGGVKQRSVIIIGTDCPYMDSEYLQQASAALTDHDVVLGPANDGGYVLIGFKSLYSWLFCDVDWGSDRVLAQTRRKLVDHGISWYELPFLSDIDRPEDLRALKNEMPELLFGI
jgi:rSAM/selenodomain-associated transferase 1